MASAVRILIAVAVSGLLTLAPLHALAFPSPPSQAVPVALERVGSDGEDLYDLAKQGDWAAAKAKLASLQAAATQLHPGGNMEKEEIDQLGATLARLDAAVGAHDRTTAMREANQVTSIAAHLTAPFNPPVPAQVALLDYEGRELEMAAAAADTVGLRATARELQRTWEELRPALEARRGGVAESARFAALVRRAEAAPAPGEYAKLAKAVLDEVDKVEAVFTRSRR